MSNKVSIIVPVYNSEKTLDRCIRSVCTQSYRNLEIVLVNDGSMDKSFEICEKYKQQDERIVVLNKKNRGVSSARNEGLKVATGEFIQFVDADDYIDSNMTEYLLETICKNNADLVICGYNRLDDSNIEKKYFDNFDVESLLDFKDGFEELYSRALFNAPWNKLYRKNKITKYFDESLSVGEDLMFNLCYVSNCDKISVVDKTFYNYDVSRQHSLTGCYEDKLFDTEIMLHEEVKKFLKNKFGSNEFCKINEVFAKEIYYYLKKMVVLSENSRDVKLKKIQDCFENNVVKDMLSNVNVPDVQIKIVCALMNLRCKKMIYLFFKLKNIIKKSDMR